MILMQLVYCQRIFLNISYLFIYNYGRWNQSIAKENGESIENESIIPEDRIEDTFIKHIAINNPATLQKMGELVIYYSTEGLDKIVQRENAEVKSSFFLFKEDGQLVYANNQKIPEKFVENLPNANYDNQVKWQGDTYYVNSIKGIGQYTAFTVIPHKEMNKLTVVKGTMWLLIIPFITIAIILTYSFMRNYSARIRRIDASIQEVQKGKFSDSNSGIEKRG